jgi:hypothetical protein
MCRRMTRTVLSPLSPVCGSGALPQPRSNSSATAETRAASLVPFWAMPAKTLIPIAVCARAKDLKSAGNLAICLRGAPGVPPSLLHQLPDLYHDCGVGGAMALVLAKCSSAPGSGAICPAAATRQARSRRRRWRRLTCRARPVVAVIANALRSRREDAFEHARRGVRPRSVGRNSPMWPWPLAGAGMPHPVVQGTVAYLAVWTHPPFWRLRRPAFRHGIAGSEVPCATARRWRRRDRHLPP